MSYYDNFRPDTEDAILLNESVFYSKIYVCTMLLHAHDYKSRCTPHSTIHEKNTSKNGQLYANRVMLCTIATIVLGEMLLVGEYT